MKTKYIASLLAYIASNLTSHSEAPGLGLADPNSFFSIANPGITSFTTTLVRSASSELTEIERNDHTI